MVKRHRWGDLRHGRALSVAAKPILIFTLLTSTAGCQQGTVTSSPKPSSTPSATVSALSACPATPATPGPQIMLQKLPAPDDLAFDNDGRLLFSDIKAGTVFALKDDGTVERGAGGMSAAEGILVEAAGAALSPQPGRH